MNIKYLEKLKLKKYKDLEKKFLVEGFHLVSMAKNHLELIITTNKDLISEDLKHIKVLITSFDVIKKLSETKTPQPIIGVCSYFEIDVQNPKRILILDNVSDPSNVGSLIRSALAFNIDLIVLSLDSCSKYNSKVIRTSQGAIFEIGITSKDLKEYIKSLNGFTIYGTSLKNSVDLKNIKKVDKFALVLGNEGSGVSQEILDITDSNIYIPISKIDSLNVVVAGSIIMNYLND